MSEAARPLEPSGDASAPMVDYDAFLSYTHSDRPVVSGMQRGLHHIGRRLGQLRALRVFRDDTDLTASPDLWGRITNALDRSRFLIVTLSPRAAASEWVNKEIGYWLEHQGLEKLMLVVAAGQLHWDQAHECFDPQVSDAAPPVLSEPGSLPAEPLFIDVSGDAPWDHRSPAFRDKLTALAAPIHGKPKDQLSSDDLREQRRFRRLRAAAIAGLAVLTVAAVVAALIAVVQRQQAIRHLHEAVVAKLNAEGAAMLAGSSPGGDTRALHELLAANAIAANGVPILNAQIARFTTQKIIETGPTPRSLAYSPDGRRVATVQLDGTVQQWDCASGQPVGAVIKAHAGKPTAVAYTRDGQTIASAGADGTMRLWNANNGAALNSTPTHVDPMTAIAVSPRTGRILTAGGNDSLQIWDPRDGNLLATGHVFSDQAAMITDLVFNPSGTLLAASGVNGGIVIFDTKPLKPHGPTLVVRDRNGEPEEVDQIAFSGDGHTIAATGDSLQLFNADTGTPLRTIQLGTARGAYAEAVAFSPDGHRVATGLGDGTLKLWDPDSGTQVGQTLTGHTGFVDNIEFSPDGHQIATTGADATLRLWSAGIGQSLLVPDHTMLDQVDFSPDGRRVAISDNTGIRQWDVGSGQPLPSIATGGGGTKPFAFVEGGRIVTAAFADGTVQVWNAATGQPVGQPVHIDVPRSRGHFAFSPSGREVAEIAWDQDNPGTLLLWDVATGQAVGRPTNITASAIGTLAFSPDGHRVAAAYKDGLRLWNADTGALEGNVLTDPQSPAVTSLAFSHDGNAVAAGRLDGAVDLWDLATRKQLPHSPLSGHTGPALSIAFGPAHELVTGGLDATLRLWDTVTGNPTAAPLKWSDAINNVTLSPDGRLVAWTSLDGTLSLSPAVADPSQLCAKLSANMSHKQWREWVSPDIGYTTLCPKLPMPPD